VSFSFIDLQSPVGTSLHVDEKFVKREPRSLGGSEYSGRNVKDLKFHYYICLYVKQLAKTEKGQWLSEKNDRSDNCAKISSYTIPSVSTNCCCFDNNVVHLIEILGGQVRLRSTAKHLKDLAIRITKFQKKAVYRRSIDEKMPGLLQKLLHGDIIRSIILKRGFLIFGYLA
jgi:hypothetical protein